MSEAQILEIVDIFSDLTVEQLEQIYQICTQKVVKKGEVVVRENTPSTEIYIILEGEVEILIGADKLKHPREEKIGILDRGQSFGEVALVDQGLRSASVRCHSDSCRLLEISRDTFLVFLKQNPEIGFIVMYNLAADICLKFREASYRY
jgi:CRP/FNR family transcriptional regulator, cyclic AMP receptor protein